MQNWRRKLQRRHGRPSHGRLPVRGHSRCRSPRPRSTSTPTTSSRPVDPDWLAKGVKSPKHLMLDPDNCILCRACEDVCPWNCIYMMSTGHRRGTRRTTAVEAPRSATRTRCSSSTTTRAPVAQVRGPAPHRLPCTMRGCREATARTAHDGLGARVATRRGRLGRGRDEGEDVCEAEAADAQRSPRPASARSEVWKSIFRPGSIFRRGYRDTSRDRALATMNNVLYHLHPVKVKRHGLKLTYTFCLGGPARSSCSSC
mgnify:CR=1 FL=1